MIKSICIGASLLLFGFALFTVVFASENVAVGGANDARNIVTRVPVTVGSGAALQKFEIPIPREASLIGEPEFKSLRNSANEELGCVVNLKCRIATSDTRAIAVWFARQDNKWNLAGQWEVDTFNHKEEGERNESQTFTIERDGSLKRFVKRDNIEGIKTLCGDTCKCVIWQTRTVRTEEEETLRWDASTQAAVRVANKKWYVTQPEENVLSICKKLDIPMERFSTLYYLNPGIQKLDKLPDGMKLLVEKSPK